ncbi:MAG: GNAT family N-acetyltransferase [Chromatiales bacterium]|nr:GNAT family N-acetyltransferase [Chromatiales bacterium]
MNQETRLETERLILRAWIPEDLIAFAQLNADPEVMRYFQSTLSRSESDELAMRIQDGLKENGWGFWAIERRDSSAFIGFVGLNRPDYNLPFQPCVEVGWRLARTSWGSGFATEAANAALEFGFVTLALPEIVSFTAVGNVRSRAVMERLGMRVEGEFDHPQVSEQSPLRRHVLYRLKNVCFWYPLALLSNP